MKTTRRLLASLLAVAMLLSVLSACSTTPDPTPTQPTTGNTEPAGAKYTVTFYNNGEVYETVEVAKGEKLTGLVESGHIFHISSPSCGLRISLSGAYSFIISF